MRINVCHTCGEEFTKPHNPSREYKYCSAACCGANPERRANHSETMRGKPCWRKGIKGLQPWQDISGLNRGEPWNKGKTTGLPAHNKKPDVFIDCAHCGQSVKIKPAKLGRSKYCSKACQYADKTIDHSERAERRRQRCCPEYRDWRAAVFERDDYTCQVCGQRGGKLNADHIKRFADFPELRFEVSNGRTLCVECHRLTPTYGNRRQESA